MFLEKDDITLLSEVFSLQPPAPNDIIDAILNHLHHHDCVLRSLPHEIIRKVIAYF